MRTEEYDAVAETEADPLVKLAREVQLYFRAAYKRTPPPDPDQCRLMLAAARSAKREISEAFDASEMSDLSFQVALRESLTRLANCVIGILELRLAGDGG